ncbi:T9SS-dependent choice-of-anchor J family protein [Flavobacterium cerinum]|uniref:T9SS type A sorting domain-containing protein n=1 Tax=Flavobacterium cerinum TaxID=2502784 RepID=A0A3S3SE53_9FLAO|nr:choice-of-anchor J domain-containing protein [Flavobacterium cerinum]RWW99745.1 T9SS type A sorting domain-containing protein [Flavobacterium cerinum]
MKKTLLAVMALASLCSYAQQPIEGFENPWTGSPAAPPGWTVVNEAGPAVTWKQSTVDAVDQPAYQGNYAAYLNRETVSSGVTKDWLISPLLYVPSNGIVEFYSRLTLAGDQGSIYKVLISTNPDASNLSSYTALYTATELQINPVQTEYNRIEVALPPALVGTTVHVAFYMEGNNMDRWLIDDVQIRSQCSKPLNLNVNNITINTATLAWTEAGTATMWEVAVVPAGDVPPNQGVIASANPFVVNNLVAGDYKFYVRAICSPANVSEWSGPFSFTTIITENVVSGIVKYDANGDTNCGAGDAVLPGAEILVSIDGTFAYSIYTNANGEYKLYNLPDGVSTLNLQVVGLAGFPAIPVLVEEVEFDAETHELDIAHCLPQPAVVNDLAVSITPISVARPGFDATYKLVVQNKGNTTVEGATVNLTFNDDRMNYLSGDFTSPVVTTNNMVITLGDLTPYSMQTGNIVFSVLQPPVNIGGETLAFTAVLSEEEDDATPDNNTALLNQVIVNSFDPNDITVHEGEKIYQHQAEGYLTYTIRFQNTGTAEAVNVRLENTLDELLDWATFEPIASSHVNTVMRTDDQLEFKFDNINLPDDKANEPGSHGYVTYRIKPKATFGVGNTVFNTAEIYFDFNPAIVTNTAKTTVIEMLGVNENQLAVARLYPNPVQDQLQIAVQQGDLQSVNVYDLNGRLCITSTNATVVNTQALVAGMYFVKVTTTTGTATYKIMRN